MKKSHKLLLLGGIMGVFPLFSYVEHEKFRKRKGIYKMAQIYLRDNVGKDTLTKKRELKNQIEKGYEMHLFHASRWDYLKSEFQKPYGILFPRRLESVQKIMKIANKYNVGVMNLDMNELEDYQKYSTEINIESDEKETFGFYSEKPFIILNQKHMNDFELDTEKQTVRIGVGCTIGQVNEYLKQHQLELPIEAPPNTRIFTIINQNQFLVNSTQYTNVKQILKGLTVVLANGMCIQTSPNNLMNSFSQGIDFTNLFVGQNANFAIAAEAELMIFPIQNRVWIEQNFDFDYLSITNMYYLLQGVFKFLKNNPAQIYKWNMLYFKNDSQMKFEVQAQNQLDIQQILNNYVNPYVYRELWKNKNSGQIKSDQIQENDKIILKFHFDQKGIFQCLTQVNEVIFPVFQKMEILSIDLKNQTLDISISKSNYSLTTMRQITTFFNNQNCRLIYCSDDQLNTILKAETLPYECGNNHMLFQQQLKQQCDKKNILINENFLNDDLSAS